MPKPRAGSNVDPLLDGVYCEHETGETVETGTQLDFN